MAGDKGRVQFVFRGVHPFLNLMDRQMRDWCRAHNVDVHQNQVIFEFQVIDPPDGVTLGENEVYIDAELICIG
jgi:hypothetical protein